MDYLEAAKNHQKHAYDKYQFSDEFEQVQCRAQMAQAAAAIAQAEAMQAIVERLDALIALQRPVDIDAEIEARQLEKHCPICGGLWPDLVCECEREGPPAHLVERDWSRLDELGRQLDD